MSDEGADPVPLVTGGEALHGAAQIDLRVASAQRSPVLGPGRHPILVGSRPVESEDFENDPKLVG
jgi:hypothetical protein